MATPTMRFKPEMWTTLVDAALFEQAATSAAVVATVPMGTSVATVGESADNVWRLCVAGDPERLLFIQRRQLAPAVPGGDPALIRHVADAFNGVRHFTQAELDAAIAAIPRSLGDWLSPRNDLATIRCSASRRTARRRKPMRTIVTSAWTSTTRCLRPARIGAGPRRCARTGRHWVPGRGEDADDADSETEGQGRHG